MHNKEWNRKIISAIVAHFIHGLQDRGIHTHYEGQARNTNSTAAWAEVRIADLRSRQVDSTQYEYRIAVNILCTTPSGLNTEEGLDLYAIEDMLGIAESLFTSIYVEGFGCLSLASELQQFRPYQVASATDLKQASVTGYFELRFNKETD